jgi:hypothetical protein
MSNIYRERYFEKSRRMKKNVKMAMKMLWILLVMWISSVDNAEQVSFVYPIDSLNIGSEKLEFPMSLRL